MNPLVLTARYARFEFGRIWRNPRFLLFSILLPVIMYSAFTSGTQDERLGSISVGTYIMISMATFGTMTAILGTGGRIALERSGGWSRQLRLTALGGAQYLTTKIAAAFTLALPALVAVFAVAYALGRARLPVVSYAEAGAWVLLGMVPLAAFSVWLGYALRADNAMQVSGGLASLLALAGGVWVPVEQFPGWLAEIARALPMYWAAQAGRRVVEHSWVGWHGLAVLAVWTVALGALAARAHSRDQLRA